MDDKRAAVRALVRALRSTYVFPDVAEEIIDVLESNLSAGEYGRAMRASEFARRLTADLRSVNDDRHLAAWPTPPASERIAVGMDRDFLRARGRESNYGFVETRILSGNVGYLRLSNFSLDELYDDARLAATAAMAFLANTDSLILDLRGNPGGGARLVRYLASYFFDATPVHLNDYYFRTTDSTLEYWTLAEIPGTRLPDLDLRILLDGDSFSSAEAFSYNLKHLGRAVIVGEPSGGGAHGGATLEIGAHFEAYIPFSRSIHPVTKTDFEGTGVLPDIEVAPKTALLVAHMSAIDALLDTAPTPEDASDYAEILMQLEQDLTVLESSTR